jgi:hypothetical protein
MIFMSAGDFIVVSPLLRPWPLAVVTGWWPDQVYGPEELELSDFQSANTPVFEITCVHRPADA